LFQNFNPYTFISKISSLVNLDDEGSPSDEEEEESKNV
jgi:hypothetical protein